MFQAKENFKKQLEYFKPHIDDGLDFRMGLTFWTDRKFTANEMAVSANHNQYKCGLPLTNISTVCMQKQLDHFDSNCVFFQLTDAVIDTAFEGLTTMYSGADLPEDLLGGIVFSRTDLGYNNYFIPVLIEIMLLIFEKTRMSIGWTSP